MRERWVIELPEGMLQMVDKGTPHAWRIVWHTDHERKRLRKLAKHVEQWAELHTCAMCSEAAAALRLKAGEE